MADPTNEAIAPELGQLVVAFLARFAPELEASRSPVTPTQHCTHARTASRPKHIHNNPVRRSLLFHHCHALVQAQVAAKSVAACLRRGALGQRRAFDGHARLVQLLGACWRLRHCKKMVLVRSFYALAKPRTVCSSSHTATRCPNPPSGSCGTAI